MLTNKSGFTRTLSFVVTASVFCGAQLCSVAFSQLQTAAAQQTDSGLTSASSHKRIKFDVVSIRPSRPGAAPGGFSITADGYKQVGMPLIITLLMAYMPMANFPMDRIHGAPSWVENVPYDIEAKVAPEDVPLWQSLNQSRTRKDELESMLQEVLRDRMHLVAHKAPTLIKGYALVFKKQSPKLVVSSCQEPVPERAAPMPGGGMMLPVKGSEESSLRFYRTSMDALALDLTQEASATSSMIENRTGLVGKFDFELPERSGLPDSDQESNASDNTVLPWDVRAIGLDLVYAKIASWNLVIDHIDRPSEN